VIDVDELALRSALSNLIDNAMRFAPPGSTVRVVGRDAVTGDGVTGDGVPDQYVIEVLDDGPGIDEAFLPTAFERFSRPDASRNRSHGGAGLGLAIVKALIESHGGTVGIENRQKGALARITLPVARETAEVTRSEGTNSS
jgi:signal transduction histidine kinase